MKSALFCFPLKEGTLNQYLAFAKEANQRTEEYSEMLKRYDIHSAKAWNVSLNNKEYIFVYHDVGDNFKEKMQSWDNSTHPFDTWFRESLMAVYDVKSVGTVTEPNQVFDFKA